MTVCWKITFITQNAEAGEAALEALGALVWSMEKQADGTQFQVYLEDEPQSDTLALPEDATAHIEYMPPHDWVSQSQENLPPVRVPPFFVHGAHDAPKDGGWHNIEMQAGMAFGSGHHGTTQGCLFLFADLLKRRPRPLYVADIGCGSGTLAIAAAKVGCRAIWASDNDPIAVNVTADNARVNKVAPHIRAFTAAGVHHPAYIGRRFDVIFANILAAPLIRLAADFERHLAPQGRVIISGLLNEQARSVKARYRACGLKIEQEYRIGQWTSLCLMR